MHSHNLIQQDGELFFFDDFLDRATALNYFQQLYDIIPWQQREITMFGNTVDQPRLISWHAEPHIKYSYSGIDLSPSPWNGILIAIKQQVEEKTQQEFNSAFLNLYRHGKDYMGWHRDNEKTLGPKPLIASVSLGAERKFKFKHITHDLNHDILLNTGSLLVMQGDIQLLLETLLT